MARSRQFVAVLALILLVLCGVHGVAAQEATDLPEDQPIDLTGLWMDSGRVVQVTHSGSTVVGMYVEPHECDHHDGTTSETNEDFNATLDGYSFTGEISSCYWDTANPSEAGFRNVPLDMTLSEDGNTLSGTWYNSVLGEDMPLEITRITCRLTVYNSENFTNEQVVVDVLFIPLLKRIDAYAADHNVQLYITDSLRTSTNVPGAIVDPAQNSNHLVGHAIDMNIEYTPTDGSSGFCNSDCLGGNNPPADVEAFLNDIRNDPDLRWGGDFNTPDTVHIDDGLNVNDPDAWQAIRDEIQADPACFLSE